MFNSLSRPANSLNIRGPTPATQVMSMDITYLLSFNPSCRSYDHDCLLCGLNVQVGSPSRCVLTRGPEMCRHEFISRRAPCSDITRGNELPAGHRATQPADLEAPNPKRVFGFIPGTQMKVRGPSARSRCGYQEVVLVLYVAVESFGL